MKINITKQNGKWLINSKPYCELSGDEKTFFDEFIREMKFDYVQYVKITSWLPPVNPKS